MTAETDLEPSSSEDPGDELTRQRDLVVLIFRAVLRRDPEEVDAAAFTNALQNGMPIYDFVSELMSTPEFSGRPQSVPTTQSASAPAQPGAGASLPELMGLSLGLLQARLTEKGCLVQLGPVADPDGDQGVSTIRMERMMRTLAVLDAL